MCCTFWQVVSFQKKTCWLVSWVQLRLDSLKLFRFPKECLYSDPTDSCCTYLAGMTLPEGQESNRVVLTYRTTVQSQEQTVGTWNYRKNVGKHVRLYSISHVYHSFQMQYVTNNAAFFRLWKRAFLLGGGANLRALSQLCTWAVACMHNLPNARPLDHTWSFLIPRNAW